MFKFINQAAGRFQNKALFFFHPSIFMNKVKQQFYCITMSIFQKCDYP